jgi:putative pyruvate formate lyase activating enzyme
VNLRSCTICPRGCGADRTGGSMGFCRSGAGYEIASICAHRGEEPVLSGARGMCNVFFSHCNLQCVYCQNFQISRNASPVRSLELDEVVARVVAILESGATHVGFVSPSHMIEQMKSIIGAIRAAGCSPVFVMNTNAYDRADVLRSLEGLIDVYLPDFKYMDTDLARELSDAADYPEVALAALREMYRQKGSSLRMGENGTVASGLIVRHLVIPGHVDNSRACLRALAEELSPSVHVSLMSQYYPPPVVAECPDLDRTINQGEYEAVMEELERLGFHRGWFQEFGSAITYQPDFSRPHPFE